MPSVISATELPAASDRDRDVDVARRVLATEARGLDALAESLDGLFSRAVDALAAIAGRVVVTGMGKSGHVARKVAATLASTGTPAIYVHPGEASHGDLGMITRDDAVVALSNSGETTELGNVIAYTRRFGIPLVAIAGRSPSTLVETADVALVLPRIPEACALGLAPTTSTTVMLALGDALAIALLERKGFSAENFHVLHPGGRLGQRLVRVGDLMHAGDRVPLTGDDVSMTDALLEMTAKSFGCIGIVDSEGRLAGIITDGDLRRHMSDDLLRRTTGAIMTRDPKVIRRDALAAEALAVMNARQITSLFVVEADIPVGILHLHDCLRAGVA